MNTGTSRKSRENKALLPDYILLDERSMQDMITATLSYAKRINYYNEQNEPDGDWQSFFLNDPIFIVALISETNITTLKTNNDAITHTSNQNENLRLVEISRKLSNAFQLINIVQHWNELLIKSNYEGELTHEVDDLLKAVANNIKTIDSVLNFIEKNINDDHDIQTICNKLILDFDLKPHETQNNETTHFNSYDALNLLNAGFNNMYGDVVYFKETVSKKFQQELTLNHDHLPHIGLLLAFYKLFKYAQIEINNTTKKHLDYYYRELLQQRQRQDSQSHKTMISCLLKRGVDNVIIDKNTPFNFDLGDPKDYIFTANASTEINRAYISDIKTLYKSTHAPFEAKYDIDPFGYNTLYTADVLENINARTAIQTNNYEDFPLVFGEHNYDPAQLGFIISSPTLILEEGDQVITIDFKLINTLFEQHPKTHFYKLFEKEFEIFLNKNPESTEKDKEKKKDDLKENIKIKFFKQAFNIFITDREGWKLITYSKTTINDRTVTIRIPLKSLDDQLISYNPALHEGDFETQWPCIKILLNNDATYHPYSFLKEWTLEYINIIADVSEVTNLKLSNSNGEIDNTIPFTPFGALPEIGSFLRIQNPIILQNNLTSLEFYISWNGLPQHRDGFKSYYAEYNKDISNDSFKASITQTRNLDRNTNKLAHEFNLFETDTHNYLKNTTNIQVNLEDFELNNKMFQAQNNLSYDKASIYFILKKPNIGFGHNIFPKIYAKAALQSSRLFKKSIPLPNQAYTPIIDQLKVRYRNSTKDNVLRKQDEDSANISLIHLYPFGHALAFPGSIKSECHLLPQINKKGNLFIALQNISRHSTISIGFDLIPAVYAHSVLNAPKVTWKYLSNNDWLDLSEMVLQDDTKGLIKSGIIKIQVPHSIPLDNTRMAPGKFWIKAEFDGIEDINSRVKNIFTQAISLISKTNIPLSHFNKKLKHNKINVAAIRNKNIEKVIGPMNFVSEDNKEDHAMYYNRVSEQLRHKNRGVTNWDLERIVLEKFKYIEKVRVFGRNNYPNELVQGSNTQIVVIPKSKMDHQILSQGNTLDIDSLNEIKTYVKTCVSAYAKIEVCNPVFEELKVRCRVQFTETQQSRYLRDQLNKELITFLSADLTESNNDSLFDRSFTKTEIFNFINSKPYVQKVTDFSVIQLINVIDKHKVINTEDYFADPKEDDVPKKVWELSTISAYAILTSAKSHHIEVSFPDTPVNEKIKGIGDITIGSDFIVINKEGVYIED